MSTYDNKLSEWLKHVEQQEKELKSKKQTQDPPQEESRPAVGRPPAAAVTPAPVRETTTATISPKESPANAVETPKPVTEPDVTKDDASGLISRIERIERIEPIAPVNGESGAELFEDADIPPVEDFLSFLGRSREHGSETLDVPYAQTRGEGPLPDLDTREAPFSELRQMPVEESVEIIDTPVEPVAEPRKIEPPLASREIVEPLDLLTEGTGEPRPVSELLKSVNEPVAEAKAAPVAQPKPKPVQKAEPLQEQMADEAASADVQAGWDRMPHHLQTLFAAENGEVAQNSYKTFKESRGQLIQRLLDPVISLEESARILNVCPTTVRRYTNRGILKHIRTAGNQRRFRLSDVLTFMESNTRAETAPE